MTKLSNYKAKQPVGGQLLKEGEHVVSLKSYLECTSFDKIKGMKIEGEKEDLPEWINPIEELAILCVSADGSIAHRLNQSGVKRFSELTEKEIKSGKFVDINGFACEKTKKGLVRLEDTDRTEKCESILDKFLYALGAEEDDDALEVLDAAIAEKRQFIIKVTREVYGDDDQEQFKIDSFKRVEAGEKSVRKTRHADLEA